MASTLGLVVVGETRTPSQSRTPRTRSARDGADNDRMRAVLRLIGPQEITPMAERMILEVWDAEARLQKTAPRSPETEG